MPARLRQFAQEYNAAQSSNFVDAIREEMRAQESRISASSDQVEQAGHSSADVNENASGSFARAHGDGFLGGGSNIYGSGSSFVSRFLSTVPLGQRSTPPSSAQMPPSLDQLSEPPAAAQTPLPFHLPLRSIPTGLEQVILAVFNALYN